MEENFLPSVNEMGYLPARLFHSDFVLIQCPLEKLPACLFHSESEGKPGDCTIATVNEKGAGVPLQHALFTSKKRKHCIPSIMFTITVEINLASPFLIRRLLKKEKITVLQCR
jgi:hypothetical protein